ncbi:MAG: alkaline phosphatase, partial [Deltaproteobacteria bacterium]|nr:alkaline phosphatase [Deltaproteobacteria bacterium]
MKLLPVKKSPVKLLFIHLFLPLLMAVALAACLWACNPEKVAPVEGIAPAQAAASESGSRRSNAVRQKHRAKYVFLFIGDGMGASQVALATDFRQILLKKSESVQLPFTGFPVQTRVTTFSNDSDVTDSAAAGTALATGHKTNNGIIAKSPDLTMDFESIATRAQRKGYKVGIVTSVSMNHATPAVFYAHQNSRDRYYDIAMSLGLTQFAFVGGGGFHQAAGENGVLPDAYQNAVNHGYRLIHAPDAFKSLPSQTTKLFAMHPVLMSDGSMPFAMEPGYAKWPLSDIVSRAARYLDNDKGFFMMVEGGKIDWACHENDGAAMLHEVLAFSDAVDAALGVYRQYPQETLIVVTADHETGGLMQSDGAQSDRVDLRLLQYQRLALTTLNARIADALDKNTPMSEVLALIEENTGLGDGKRGLALTAEEQLQLKFAFARMTQGLLSGTVASLAIGYSSQLQRQHRIGTVAIDILNRKAGLDWGSLQHTGVKVPL